MSIGRAQALEMCEASSPRQCIQVETQVEAPGFRSETCGDLYGCGVEVTSRTGQATWYTPNDQRSVETKEDTIRNASWIVEEGGDFFSH